MELVHEAIKMSELAALINPATYIPQIGSVGVFGLIGFAMFLKHLKDTKGYGTANGNGNRKSDMAAFLVDSQVLNSLNSINQTLASQATLVKEREEREKERHMQILSALGEIQKSIRHMREGRD